MKKSNQTGYLLPQLLILLGVLSLLSWLFEIKESNLDTFARAESSRKVVTELMVSLDEHILLQSNLNNQTDDVTCNDFDITLIDLVDGGFFKQELTLTTPEIVYEVNYIKTISPSPKISLKEVRLTFDNVKLATDYSFYLKPTYQADNVLFFQEPVQAKGKTAFISSLYREPTSGCWKRARNL